MTEGFALVFNSAIFLFVFLPVVFALYRIVPGQRAKNALLGAISLVFYAFGGIALLPLLLISVAVSYGFGLLLGKEGDRRKLWCALAVICHLGMLGIFKYLDFAITSINGLFRLSLPLQGLALPVGISFFTFQAISYVVDVYRDKEQCCRNFGKVLLYIAFFPRLLAGPIVRYRDAVAQLDHHPTSPAASSWGLRRFVKGMAKKILIADLTGAMVNEIFALEPELMSTPLAWLAAIGYCVQIYFDFSGYSDMAVGIGALFGFRFPENFEHPYSSRSLSEFWRRWHMTLNRWFVDYLYIPLGGSRRGERRTAINKLIVFFFTGLWHGAGWTFIAWGMWHGLFVSLETAAKPLLNKLEKTFPGRCALRVYTLLVVILGFVMFRATTFAQGWLVISRMFAPFTAPEAKLALETIVDPGRMVILVMGIILSMPLRPLIHNWAKATPRRAAIAEPVTNALTLVLFVVCLLCISGSGFSPFIYFQF